MSPSKSIIILFRFGVRLLPKYTDPRNEGQVNGSHLRKLELCYF